MVNPSPVELAAIVLDRRIGTHAIDKSGRCPLPTTVKVVLMLIASADGEVLTQPELARRADVSVNSVACAMGALRLMGLIRSSPVYTAGNGTGQVGSVHRVNLPAIRALPRVRAGVAA